MASSAERSAGGGISRGSFAFFAKVVDGLIIEPYPACIDAALGLKQALADATTACALQGWDVVLLEKPLHGLQDQRISP